MEKAIQKMGEADKIELIKLLFTYRYDQELMDEVNKFTFQYSSRLKKYRKSNENTYE